MPPRKDNPNLKPGQNELSNVYLEIKFESPTVAALMAEDIVDIALGSLGDDLSSSQPAADRLREKARRLPMGIQFRLNKALRQMGYS